MEVKPILLSKVVNISRQSIYNDIRRGNLIKNSGGMIDTQNKINLEWMLKHNVSENIIISYLDKIQEKEKEKEKIKVKSNQKPKIKIKSEENKNDIDLKTEIDNKSYDELEFEDISGLPARMMKLNLFQLVMKYGGPMILTNWSLILQRIMAAQEKEQKIKERRLELIEKDFVISQVVLYLEILSNFLFDYAESQPIQFISLIKSGKESIEILLKKQMTKDFSMILKNTKLKLLKQIEGLRKKYNKEKGSNNDDRSN